MQPCNVDKVLLPNEQKEVYAYQKEVLQDLDGRITEINNTIISELTTAKIPVFKSIGSGEVAYDYIGKFKHYTFKRAWRYTERCSHQNISGSHRFPIN